MNKKIQLIMLLFASVGMFAQTTVVDFEDASTYTISGWEGVAEVVSNPDATGINTSGNSAKYTTPANKAWANGVSVILNTAINYADIRSLDFSVIAPSASQIYLKLENDAVTGETQPEAYVTPTATSGDWESLTANFSEITDATEAASATFDKIFIIFNPNDNTGGEVWHFDEMKSITNTDPSAPTGLMISEGANEFTLNWDDDPLATDGFNVYISEGTGSAQYITTLAAGATSYTYTGTIAGVTITDGGTYTATVQALPDADDNAYADSGSFVLNEIEPSSPTGLMISEGTNEFTLNWDDNPLATGGFNVYISESSGSAQYITTLAAGTTSYTYTGTIAGVTITDGGTYTATVQALPDADDNAYADSGSFVLNEIEPSSPTGLMISEGTNEFTLNWDDDPLATGGFNVYISEGSGSAQYITTLAAGSTSYTYTGTLAGITIADGGTYTATVQALPDADDNAYANSGSFVLNEVEPSSPTGLMISEGTNEFTLNWDDDPLATGGFNVYISEGSGSAQYITTLAAGATSYTYTGTIAGVTITDGGTYTATVQALPDADNNAYANSGAFNLNAADPEPPTNPTGLSVVQGTDQFTLNWDNDPLATGGFNVFVSKNTDAIQYVTTVPAGSTSYTYSGTLAGIPIATDGTIYTVTVQSLPDVDGNNYSNALVYTGDIDEVILSDNDPNLHIYLAFGQSNMEGSAPVENSDFATNDRLLTLQSLDCTNLGREKNKWYVMAPPASQCFSQLSLVNTFGKEMVNTQPSNVKIGIINVAVGGSDIRLFDKDKFEDYDTLAEDPFFQKKITAYGGNPYQHLVNLGLLAKQKGVIKGILLHQGESNNGDTNWPNYVKTVYDNLITDLGLEAAKVPLLAGEVGHTNNGGLAGGMNSIIQTLPTVIPTAHVISSDGVSISSDNVHFDSVGVRELGKRYALKMTSLLTTLSTNDVVLDENKFGLIQNNPNPVTNSTNILFNIPSQTHVSLKVYSISGIQVAELINNELSAGIHSVEFRKQNLSPGYYIYTLQTDKMSKSKKMIISSE